MSGGHRQSLSCLRFHVQNYLELCSPTRTRASGATCFDPMRGSLAARIPVNVLSISELIGCSANSAATRIAFLIALAFDDPWVMKQTPFTPSNGAPPYSV